MTSRPAPLEALAAAPATSGLVLDFDGVLSPIVDDPAASQLPDRVAASLARLACTLGLLAVISGRPVEFLKERIPIREVRLLGTYGIEQVHDGIRRVDPDANKWLSQVSEASLALRDLLGAAQGIRVEEKSVSVAVHWRQAPDQPAAADRVHRATTRIAAETGLRLEAGKLTEELLPPVDMDKGKALVRLLAAENLTTVAYAGDDVGDIPALRAVSEAGGYALVVDHGRETHPLLPELADQTYAGTDSFAAWLEELASAAGAAGQ
jgi:trehalose 6-phosphate phosphatase